MKQITNANQLAPEDKGTVVEVLQCRYYGTGKQEYVWQRGILIEVAESPLRRKEITLVTKFNNNALAIDISYTMAGTCALPNTTPKEWQGVQGPFIPENAKEYMDKLRGIESERPLQKGELERLKLAS